MGGGKTMINSFNENEFRDFVSKFKWTFAKTYATTAPHEYIVLRKVGLEHKADFINAAQFIRDAGFRAFYYKSKRFYYSLGDFYYWTMDEAVKDTDLINRAKLADYELIDNSWRWKGHK
jgi:hypothetical protein